MGADYLTGGLYVFGRPGDAARFAKVLLTTASSVFIRPYARPPVLEWWLVPGVPRLRMEPDPEDALSNSALRLSWDEFKARNPFLAALAGVGPEDSEAVDRLRLEEFPRISAELASSLMSVEPSRDGPLEFRPCRLVLHDGVAVHRAYVVEAETFIGHWGMWPAADIPIGSVARIEESPFRLPARLATKMYEAGESAMGGCVFTLVLQDGRELVCQTGNAVDFVDLPDDVHPRAIVDLIPHAGRERRTDCGPAEFAWCFYRTEPEPHSTSDG